MARTEQERCGCVTGLWSLFRPKKAHKGDNKVHPEAMDAAASKLKQLKREVSVIVESLRGQKAIVPIKPDQNEAEELKENQEKKAEQLNEEEKELRRAIKRREEEQRVLRAQELQAQEELRALRAEQAEQQQQRVEKKRAEKQWWEQQRAMRAERRRAQQRADHEKLLCFSTAVENFGADGARWWSECHLTDGRGGFTEFLRLEALHEASRELSKTNTSKRSGFEQKEQRMKPEQEEERRIKQEIKQPNEKDHEKIKPENKQKEQPTKPALLPAGPRRPGSRPKTVRFSPSAQIILPDGTQQPTECHLQDGRGGFLEFRRLEALHEGSRELKRKESSQKIDDEVRDEDVVEVEEGATWSCRALELLIRLAELTYEELNGKSSDSVRIQRARRMARLQRELDKIPEESKPWRKSKSGKMVFVKVAKEICDRAGDDFVREFWRRQASFSFR
ncbi:trichohyalin [Selaginella moellendorffii]|uniref:trichohyalin n=1 Tax=Selaginella moellendorffii TaxID=88036 RepID=UPI000D1C7341|nr:trichohyalin [Selaginella moellendorffii]|eukprot:XP_024543118.1 trichohyalin [Selaginella moellendorffii]